MEDWLTMALRFVHYALLLILFGGMAFRLVGLRQVDTVEISRLLIGIAALAAPVVTVLLMLIGIAVMMGQAVVALDWATVEAMLFTTDMGWAFLARFGFLIVALGVVWISKPLSGVAVMCYAFALATLPWSGHAAASEGGWGFFHRLNDALHLLAAGFWIGAILWFLLLAVQAHRAPQQANPDLLLKGMHRFAPIGVVLVSIVAITGIINAELIFGLNITMSVTEQPYGQILLLKLALVLLMLCSAACHARYAKRWTRSMVGETDILKAVRISLAAEFGLAILVIASVALLGMMMPTE
ncbi:copper homeostasis membrane protein CopD [Methylocucumis oryzae]|uniref:Copper resistance protein D n=1 Tax=Methylocucumis oryzae TaxID=1632867 RepID=A0A0F3IE64_9GAMM|nr:copper homeostasis membrane protein CopD [Methylocucumis oryzae]KJV04972.1 hypothetical protein VZ94_21550 [Methylocucumis oryzae]